MSERVQVVVRIRPFIPSDPPDAELNTIVLDSTHVSVGSSRVFKVDRVFMMEDETADIYTESVAPLVDRFINGCNASVLAYGQTGTGKTFTVQTMLPLLLTHVLESAVIREAINVRTAPTLSCPPFSVPSPLAPPAVTTTEQSSSPSPTLSSGQPLLRLQYVEVYGEAIRDLLADPSSQLDPDNQPKIRLVTTATGAPSSPKRAPSPHERSAAASGAGGGLGGTGSAGCAVVGATVAAVNTIKQAAELIARGDAHRATGATNVHAHSSRSHAILTLFHPRYACRLDIVDLAGSEREKKTGNTGQRFQESIAINTGLLALGNVIRALSRIHRAAVVRDRSTAAANTNPFVPAGTVTSPNVATAGGGVGGSVATSALHHVPYRSSKLTRLLQDTLGGSSATLFVACVAPDTYNRDETLRTLQYCALTLQVRNEPIRQYDRLQRAQSRGRGRHRSNHRRNDSDDSEGSGDNISPFSISEGENYSEEKGSPSVGVSSPRVVEELRAAYALLQQQYDEQGEVLASMCESYTTTKERLQVCEAELRKDEEIFTQQIRAMQQLVQENQKLRHRLAKGTSRKMSHSFDAVGQEKGSAGNAGCKQEGAVRNLNGVRDRASRQPHRELVKIHTHDDPAAVLKDLLHRRALHDVAADSPNRSSCHSDDDKRPPTAGVRDMTRTAATATPNARAASPSRVDTAMELAVPPRTSAPSPHRRLDFTSGSLLRDTLSYDEGSTRRAYDIGGGMDTASASVVHWDATPPLPGKADTAVAASVPVQSFIRSLLRQHGIVTGSEKEVAAAPSSSSIIASPGAVGNGEGPQHSPPFQPNQRAVHSVSQDDSDDGNNVDDVHAAIMSPPSSPQQEMVFDRNESRRHTAIAGERDGQLLQLAQEVVRYEEVNTSLRNQVRLLEAKLDDKAREAARLRLEVQDLKDVYSSLSAMTE